MSGRGKAAVILGMLIMGLSPSFIDWQQSPEFRWQIWLYYGIGISMVAFGFYDGE